MRQPKSVAGYSVGVGRLFSKNCWSSVVIRLSKYRPPRMRRQLFVAGVLLLARVLLLCERIGLRFVDLSSSNAATLPVIVLVLVV
jgi:hypothetical protein